MPRDPKYKTVAKAVRFERIEDEDTCFIVFKVTDPQFRKYLVENWVEDIDLYLSLKEES